MDKDGNGENLDKAFAYWYERSYAQGHNPEFSMLDLEEAFKGGKERGFHFYKTLEQVFGEPKEEKDK